MEPEYEDDGDLSEDVIAGGAEAHNDDADLLAKLDEFDADVKAKAKKKQPAKDDADADEDEKPKAKKKAEDADDEEKAKDEDAEDEKPAKKPKAKEDDDEAKDADEEKPAPKKAEPAKKEEEAPSKAVEAILRTKLRAEADVARARAEVVKERQAVLEEKQANEAKWRPLEEKQRQYDAAVAQAKTPRGAVGMLKRLGVTDWESVANYAIAQAPNAAIDTKDPTFRQRFSLDDGGTGDAVEELRRKTAELHAQLEEQTKVAAEAKADAEEHRSREAYLDLVVAAVDDENAIVAQGLKKNPARVRGLLMNITAEKVRATKSRPDPKDVANELERRLREEAETYGFALPTKTKNKPIAGEHDTAPETSRNPARAKAAATDDDEDEDEILRKKLDELDEEERLKARKKRLQK